MASPDIDIHQRLNSNQERAERTRPMFSGVEGGPEKTRVDIQAIDCRQH
jgi:hypothetical protein